MATITVRALDPVTGDPLQGNGQNNFISDLAAVTQIIGTRLKLFQGEWFLDLLDGLPLMQRILGSSGSSANIQVIINLISARIFKTPYVTGPVSLSATYQNRNFTYSGTVQTVFGTVYIGNSSSQAALSSV
jgi:hypothetical protein